MKNLGAMLVDLGDATGLTPDVELERAKMLRALNNAARFLWKQDDLPMSLRSVFVRGTSSRTICFPEYVGEIRGVRKCWAKSRVFNESARFHESVPGDCFVPIVLYKSPVSDTSVDFANLRLELDAVATCAITATVQGATTDTTNKEVTVVFGNGESVKPLNIAFVSIKSIHKDALVGPNMRLMANADDEIANIPSHANTSLYIIYEMRDAGDWCGCNADGEWRAFELFYKPTFMELSQDSDTIPANNVEMQVIALAAADILGRSGDEVQQKLARGFSDRARLENLADTKNAASGIDHPIGPMHKGFPNLRRKAMYSDLYYWR